MTTTTPFPIDELNEIFELADFVVLSYTMAISSSIVLSFAMQHGKPVIVPDNEIMREFVRDGENGLWFKPKDVQSLCGAMQVMMEDSSLRKKFPNSTLQRVSTLSWNRIADATSALYLDVDDAMGMKS
jgi:glycosyltransferase involved in cell wall biosynthesis